MLVDYLNHFFLVGKPILVKKNPNPSQEQIDKIHALYIESLKKIYNDHKKFYSKHQDVDIKIT